MTESYKDFAHVYDELMEEIPYDRYVELIEEASGKPLAGLRLLDVGCGTGLLSAKLAKRGASVTGVDLSPEMLRVAGNRAASLGYQIELTEQAMEKMEMPAAFDAAVISIDSLNYVREKSAVLETFKRIYAALKPGGVLLFDVHSVFKTDVIFLEGPFVFDNRNISYIWQTEEGEEEHSVYSEITFYVRDHDGRYRRFDEVHYQRTFDIFTYVDMLLEAGFTVERIFADWEDEPPTEESERVFFQVRK